MVSFAGTRTSALPIWAIAGAAEETPWRVFARQSVRSGQAFMQSGMTGFSGGQQGISFAVAPSSLVAIIAIDASIPPATAGAVTGARTSPRTARIESTRRVASMKVTQ